MSQTATRKATVEVCSLGPDVVVVSLEGEHDLETADELRRTLTESLDRCSHLLVDLSDAEFIDSTTIQVLLATKALADAQGCRSNLILGTAPIVERTLDLTGVLATLDSVHSLDEALDGRQPPEAH